MKQLTFLASPPSSTTAHERERWHIFVDGASRGNPGKSGAGVYVFHEDKDIIKKGIYLGRRTNNQAEYLALALAFFFIKQHVSKQKIRRPNLSIFADSELMVKQMRGIYKVKNPELKLIKLMIDSLREDFSCIFRHIRREKNKIADELANHGVDTRKKAPAPFLTLLKKYEL